MSKPERSDGFDRRDVALLMLLLTLTVIVLGKDITVGGFRYGDSAAHAMDGVLIHDWVAAGPEAWPHPMEFAERQYAHYPTLGIGRHYPPGFAVVEAGFFALFGISIFTARLCVMFFGLAAIAGAYVFIRCFADRWAAMLGAAALLTLPATTQWGRQVMLEVPTLSVAVGAAIALAAYLRSPTFRRLALALSVATFALAFKQTAVFLFGAIAVTTLLAAARRAVPARHAGFAAAAAIVASAGILWSLDGHATQLLRGVPTLTARWSVEAITYYLRALPSQSGLAILALALIGGVASWKRLGAIGVFLAAWFITCYFMVTVADYKNDRHFFLGLFPVAVCAGLGWHALLCRCPQWIPKPAAACAAAFWLGATGVAAPVEHRPDYGPVVAANAERIAGHAVLISGLREGDFVFAVREHVPWRQAVVLRGSKVLYTCNGRADLDYVARVQSAEELVRLMSGLAFNTVFIEREDKVGVPQEGMLRAYLGAGGAYRRIASYEYRNDAAPSCRDATLDVYEPARPMLRTVQRVELLIPRSQRRIAMDLRNWS